MILIDIKEIPIWWHQIHAESLRRQVAIVGRKVHAHGAHHASTALDAPYIDRCRSGARWGGLDRLTGWLTSMFCLRNKKPHARWGFKWCTDLNVKFRLHRTGRSPVVPIPGNSSTSIKMLEPRSIYGGRNRPGFAYDSQPVRWTFGPHRR